MAGEMTAPESVVLKKSSEFESIEAMLEAAAEYHLEAEVVWELCDRLRKIPDMRIEDAAFDALCEWDL